MRTVMLLLTMLVAICGKAETLSIGLVSYDPPFVLPADTKNHFFGFDSDLITEICHRLQANCEFVPLTVEPLFAQTLDGTIDLALGSISITEDRMQVFLFSLPYLASKGRFISRSASAINGIEDIRQKRVGTQSGSLFKGLVQQVFNTQVTVIEYVTQPLMFQALSNNEVDAIFLDAYTAKYWSASNNGLFKLVGDSIPIGIGYGIMSSKKNHDLIKRVNETLVGMENDGSYLTIYNRYFLQMK